MYVNLDQVHVHALARLTVVIIFYHEQNLIHDNLHIIIYMYLHMDY